MSQKVEEQKLVDESQNSFQTGMKGIKDYLIQYCVQILEPNTLLSDERSED